MLAGHPASVPLCRGVVGQDRCLEIVGDGSTPSFFQSLPHEFHIRGFRALAQPTHAWQCPTDQYENNRLHDEGWFTDYGLLTMGRHLLNCRTTASAQWDGVTVVIVHCDRGAFANISYLCWKPRFMRLCVDLRMASHSSSYSNCMGPHASSSTT